jgi:Ca2+-transporting ATPase
MAASGAAWHAFRIETVLKALRSNASGLDARVARMRLIKLGPNVLAHARTTDPLELLLGQVTNTLPAILLASALVSLVFGRIVDGTVVLAVVVVNALIGAFQQYRAERAIEALSALVPEFVTVRRNGFLSLVAAAELVPGDVVLLGPGDRVPADMRLLQLRDLRIIEAALTGESTPAVKQLEPLPRDTALGDRSCMLFSGTMVATGTAEAVVVATGLKTELGRISELLSKVEKIETPLTQALARFGKALTAGIGLVAYFMLLTAVHRGFAFVDAVRTAASLVVAAVPASLPAIITVSLAVAVHRMARRNAIVRTLPSIETLGSMNVVCSDKTGTLTRGEMTVRRAWTKNGLYELSGTGFNPEGGLWLEGRPILESADAFELLLAATLCNDAAIRADHGGWVSLGDPTEIAFLVAAMKAGVDVVRARAAAPRVGEIPFDAARRYMATLHTLPRSGQWLIVKGAPEVVLSRCRRLRGGAALDIVALTALVERLAARGMRVLAVACRDIASEIEVLEATHVASLELLGLVASQDPPRAEAVRAIAKCHRAGIAVKMVTGDHPSTAKAIATELGIAGRDERVLLGSDIERMSLRELGAAARTTNVFSRVAPEHKLRLVQALQRRGNVVGMTGDGVNDAPALKRADVGVAMGRVGTAAAKDAADVILVDDNFASIAAAVEEGRRCYDGLAKSLMFVVPTNLGQSIALLIGVLAFPFVGGVPLLPVLPLQILWVNLVTGVTLAIPLAFEVAEPDLMRRSPRCRDAPLFTPELLLRCLLVGTLMGTGAILLFLDEYYGAGSSDPPDLRVRKAQTIAATTIVLFQCFYLLQCRSLRTSIFRMKPFSNPYVYLSLLLTLTLQLLFVHARIMNVVFHSAPLALREWLTAALVAASVLPVMALDKSLFENRRLRQ